MILTILTLAMVALMPPLPMLELDNVPGCHVQLWNGLGVDSGGITWTGDCRDGLAIGSGVLSFKRDGEPLFSGEGTMNDGVRTGP